MTLEQLKFIAWQAYLKLLIHHKIQLGKETIVSHKGQLVIESYKIFEDYIDGLIDQQAESADLKSVK